MAEELWNRVNIPFPGAVSTVRANFNAKTDVFVGNLLAENVKVLKLYESEVLQTEIRVLYELLYVLNNSYRNNKTFKALQQVEQCINRLKMMKLVVALKDLKDVCPANVQRVVGIKTGECIVPSQPFLEWLSLKVLGAIKLLSCTMDRCSTAFLLSRRQMKWGEFIILNMVLTSMVSRLWVIFRGILSCLCPLYEHLLLLLKEVASSHPMPYLKDTVLPECVADFLCPSDLEALTITEPSAPPCDKVRQPPQKKGRIVVKSKTRKKEDLGIAIERVAHHSDLKPFLNTKGNSQPRHKRKICKERALIKQVREAESFEDLVSKLETTIKCFKTQRKKKEWQLLNFLLFNCRRMKSLEAQGSNVCRKLRATKQEVYRVLSDHGSLMSTCGSSTIILRRKSHLVTRFHTMRSQFKASKARKKRHGTKAKLIAPPTTGQKQIKKTRPEMVHSHDDIDDIFASID